MSPKSPLEFGRMNHPASEQGVHPARARPPFAIKARKKHIDIVYPLSHRGRPTEGRKGGREGVR